jgi:hypothetical protein
MEILTQRRANKITKKLKRHWEIIALKMKFDFIQNSSYNTDWRYDFMKKLFLCDGCHGEHAIGVTTYPDFCDGQVFIEWWANAPQDHGFWTRIKRAWELFREGGVITHDVILNPDTCDQLADSIKEYAQIARKNMGDDWELRQKAYQLAYKQIYKQLKEEKEKK